MGFAKWDYKDPDEDLDYVIDWTERLAGDTVSSSVWTVPAGLTSHTPTTTSTTTKIWLSGGTLGTTYQILNRMTTAAGRIMDKTVTLKIKAK